MSGAPKGSLYHHFPGGKEELAVHAVETIACAVERLIEKHAQKPIADIVGCMAEEILNWMNDTGDDTKGVPCAFIATIASAGDTSPRIVATCKSAYESISDSLAQCMIEQGWAPNEVREASLQIIALLEGGGAISHALGTADGYNASAKAAVSICENYKKQKGWT